MTKAKRVALYLRVGTDSQTTENQRRELDAWASAKGHEIIAVFEDAGISGTKGRDRRPQFDAMLNAAVRREFDVLAAWSVDRLGRSLQDLVTTLNELKGAGVDLFLHQQALDTATPSGRAMFQMLGVFSEFEAAMIKSRVNSGLARARANGVKLGRPRIGSKKDGREKAVARVAALAGEGKGTREIARETGLAVTSVHRLLKAKGAAPG